MAKTRSNAQRDGGTVLSEVVPDQTVTQVGKAVAEIMKLRQSFEENIATAKTEEEAQDLANQVETAAVRAISDQRSRSDR